MISRIVKLGSLLIGMIIIIILACSLIFNDRPQPLPSDLRADLVVVEKSRHRLTLYKEAKPLRSYPVSLGSGGLGPKQHSGDRLTPEGKYKIIGRNPHSGYHLALRISYPDERDIRRTKAQGVEPGGDIMIHGLRNGMGWLGTLQRHFDWTAGCIAVTDYEVDEIGRLVTDGTPIEIRP